MYFEAPTIKYFYLTLPPDFWIIITRDRKMRNNEILKRTYQVPSFEVCEVRTELGFAVTGSSIEQIEGRNAEQDW